MSDDSGDQYLPGGGEGGGDETYDVPGGTGGDGTRPPPFDPAKYYDIATIGDSVEGGGSIISGSAKVLAEGLGVARENDLGYCAVHRGLYPIQSGTCAQRIKADDKKVALCGYSQLSCGHRISESFKKTKGVES